jgi:fatty-acyl-CoA synthase
MRTEDWMAETDWSFAEVITAAGLAFPDRLALVHGDRVVTWRALDERSSELAANLLAAGLVPGDTVAQYLPNRPEYLESFLGVTRASLVPMNTNYRYVDDELRYIWEDAGVRAVIFDATFRDRVDRLRASMPHVEWWIEVGGPDASEGIIDYEAWTVPGDVPARLTPADTDLVLLYTGGTTGRPKGVMWQQGDLLSLLNSMSHRAVPDRSDAATVTKHVKAAGPGAPVLVACPLMHGTGLFHGLAALTTGSTVVTLDSARFDAELLLDVIERHRVGSVIIVGDAFAQPILSALREHPQRWDLSSLRVMFSSGAMWSQPVKEGLIAAVPKLRLVDGLGSSEASGIGTSVSRAGEVERTASFRPSPNTRILLDDGSWAQPGDDRTGLLAATGFMPLGYWRDQVKTDLVFRIIDGQRWTVPGDHGVLEADGSIRLLGRGSGCINTAGEKVYPEEVEEVLKTHPSVTDAAVVGATDDRFGEVVVAFVSTKDRVGRSDLDAFARDHLAGYKVPKLIIPVDSVGRAPNGKLDHRTLKELATTAWADRA